MNLFRTSLNKLIVIAFLLLSCGKEDEVQPTMEDGKSTVVYDLAGDTRASIAAGIDGKEQRPFYTFLFRLSDQRQIWVRTAADSAQYLQTADWDIAFTGNYNSLVYLNNASQESNPGYQGSVTNTAIVLLRQSYESVTTAPTDAEFGASNITVVGWADSDDSPGWYSYNSSTHIMRPLPNRTYALRLPDGKYAKLQLISAYRGNPPAVSDMYWPAPYLTFRYYIQEDGSKNLATN